MRGSRWLAMVLAGWLGSLAAAREEVPQIPPEHLSTYFMEAPERYLVDPQGLLSAEERKEQERFLKYHAGDSEIDCYVLLFAAGQEIPGDVRAEELAERFFGQRKPALLVLYFLGDPEQVQLELSPGLEKAVSVADLARLRQQATMAAATRPGGAGQLKEFCIQAAIGLFWIEQKAGLGPGEAVVERSSPGRIADPPPPSARERLLVPLEGWWAEWGVAASVLIGGVLAGGLARVMFRLRARYRFPEALPPPRLGGDRGAGTGALIEFRSSTRSPSSQKGAPDDSLGGL